MGESLGSDNLLAVLESVCFDEGLTVEGTVRFDEDGALG